MRDEASCSEEVCVPRSRLLPWLPRTSETSRAEVGVGSGSTSNAYSARTIPDATGYFINIVVVRYNRTCHVFIPYDISMNASQHAPAHIAELR